MYAFFYFIAADDLSTPSAREGLQAAGFNSILPKEQSSQFFNLPIIKNITDKDSVSFMIYCVVSTYLTRKKDFKIIRNLVLQWLNN